MLKNLMHGKKVTKMCHLCMESNLSTCSKTDRKTDGDYDGNQKTDDSTNYRGLQTMSSAGGKNTKS